jgi:hypothetical protein
MPPDARRTGRLVLAAMLCLYLATTGGSLATDPMNYEVTKGIVERDSVAMSYNVHNMEAHRGLDGQYYAPYGLGHAVYGVPFYLAGRVVEINLGLSIGRADAVRKAAWVSGSAVAAALAVWFVFLFARRLTDQTYAAALTAMTVGLGTILWPYSKFGFNAPLAALAVVAGTYGVWHGTRSGRSMLTLIGGLWLGFALLVRHELALVAVVCLLWVYFAAGRRIVPALKAWLLIGLPVFGAGVLTLYYNQVRFGSPWDTGYLRDSTATFGSALEGFAGLLWSPGRSMFLYSLIAVPALFAFRTAYQRDRVTAGLLAGVSGVLFLFYASLEYWDADRSYGPRYVVAVLPLMCLPLAYWFAFGGPRLRVTLRILLLVSIVGQLPGVLVDFSKTDTLLGVGRIEIEDRRWDWERSGFWLNTQAAIKAVPLNVRYVLGLSSPPAVRPAVGLGRDFSEQFGYSLDFWWLYLFYMRTIHGAIALALGAALLAGAGWFLSLVGSSTRSQPPRRITPYVR